MDPKEAVGVAEGVAETLGVTLRVMERVAVGDRVALSGLRVGVKVRVPVAEGV